MEVMAENRKKVKEKGFFPKVLPICDDEILRYIDIFIL
jgi:hypothetical protein